MNELFRDEARFTEALLHSRGLLIVILDASGRIVYFNDACEEISGYREREMLGEEIWETLLLESERNEVRSVFERLTGGKSENRHENFWRTREGDQKYISFSNTTITDDAGAVEYVISVGTDISDRRRVETKLHESEARTRAILNTTVDGIITIGENALVESFNHAAERIFGYRADEVIGRNVHVLMPEPYKSEHDGYIDNYVETGDAKIIGIGREVTGRRKDGTIFPMELAVSEVDLKGRRIFTGIVRDISERRRLEKEVLRIGDQERRRIGQDLHDGLGQMLTGIGLISRNLARQLENQGNELADELNELAELVKEADEYARGLARGLVPVELEMGGLTGALERLAHNAERLFGITCTLDKQVGVPVEDTTHAMHLYRIAQEALSNAVRHGKAGHVSIVLFASAERVRLRIQDDGTGFTNSSLVSLAEPKPRTGMGVRIMHYRARIMGASLEIFGEEGEGTTITCTLRRGGQGPARDIKPQIREFGMEGERHPPPGREGSCPHNGN